MAVKTKVELAASKNALFADNITGDISAQDLRNQQGDVIDSLVASTGAAQTIATDIDFTGAVTVDGVDINGNLKAKTAIAATDVGWRDNIVDIVVKGSGANSPAWSIIRDGIYGYEFNGTATLHEFWVKFHIDHDYKLGSAIFPHVHFCIGNSANTGNIKWFFEYTIAKGHQQATGSDFAATTTVSQVQAITAGSQYKHYVCEYSTGITDAKLEPDSIIMMRIYRDGADAGDTFPDSVWGICADLHYQFDRYGTLNKAPDFYA